jgi:hypothetical protein
MTRLAIAWGAKRFRNAIAAKTARTYPGPDGPGHLPRRHGADPPAQPTAARLARRHPPVKDAQIQPNHSGDRGELALDQAARLAPLDDLATDPRVVRRRVDPTRAVSFAGRAMTRGLKRDGSAPVIIVGLASCRASGEAMTSWQLRSRRTGEDGSPSTRSPLHSDT